jgi:hypothetical protein
MMFMEANRYDPIFRRPWTMAAASLTAAHHGFELSNGVGLVGQPELGLVGASALWGAQIPTWIALAAKGGKQWDRLLAVWSGAALGGCGCPLPNLAMATRHLEDTDPHRGGGPWCR